MLVRCTHDCRPFCLRLISLSRCVVGSCRGQERWVQIAAAVDSRTAAECKGRYRKLCKETKAQKEEERRLSNQTEFDGRSNVSEAGDAGAEARVAKADRLAQLHTDAETKMSGIEDAAAPAQEPMSDAGASATGASGTNRQTKKLKPSERRALKKAEKAARLEAKARQRVAAAAGSGSSDEEARPGIGNDTTGGGLGWGVIQL
jgi:hypothetical protein